MPVTSLYDLPEIYAELLAPAEDLVEDVREWLADALDRPLASILDPACGPGTWLLPFATRGLRVAGNDLSAAMIGSARRRLPRGRAELTIGDMRRLRLAGAPFDAALNLHGSVGHLGSDSDVVEHLRSVASCLRAGGVYLLGLSVFDETPLASEPVLLFQTPPTKLAAGGTAAVLYESLGRDALARSERIRVLVLTHDVPGAPPTLLEEYDLRTFTFDALLAILDAVPEFRLERAYAMELAGRPEIPLGPDAGDVTLVLRRT